MTNDPDPTLEDEMRAWLRAMVDAVVTDPPEREARYAEIERAIAKLNGGGHAKRAGNDAAGGK